MPEIVIESVNIWFWVCLVLEFIVLLTIRGGPHDEDSESTAAEMGFSVLTFLVFLALINWYGGVPVWSFITKQPLVLLIYLGIYVAIGIPWGIFRWVLDIKRRVRAYQVVFLKFLNNKNLPSNTKVLPDDLKEAWAQYSRHESRVFQNKPSASNEKLRIIRWIYIWPVDLVSFLCGDVFVEFFHLIYRCIANCLQKLADRIWQNAGIEENFKQ